MTVDERFDRSSIEFAGKTQLRAYGQFLQEFNDDVHSRSEHPRFGDVTPILLNFAPIERCSVHDLIISGNGVFDKVMTAFVAVCREAIILADDAEKKFFPVLLIYGEGVDFGGTSNESNALNCISAFVPLLQELSCFVERSNEIVRNILWQLAGLYRSSGQTLVNMTDVHLTVVWEVLTKLLSVLLTLDEIIKHQPYLKEHWDLYLKSVHLVHHNPKRFGLESHRLQRLRNVLLKLDAQLMSGFILQNCVEQPLDTEVMHVSKNSALMEEFVWAIKFIHARMEARAGDFASRDQRWLLPGVCSLYVLYFYIFRTLDKRLFKTIWDTLKKVVAYPLVGDIVWLPCEYLHSKIPEADKVVDKKALSVAVSQFSEMLMQKTQSLPRECQTLTLRVSNWISQLQSFKGWSSNVNAELSVHLSTIQTGVQLAFYINRLIQYILNGHTLEKRALNKTTLESVVRLIESLKALEHDVYCHWLTVAEWSSHLVQRVTASLVTAVTSAKQTIGNEKKYTNRRVDALSALLLAENALNGPPTTERGLIVSLGVQFGAHGKMVKQDDFAAVSALLKKLDLLVNLGARIREACSCSFLLFHRGVILTCFSLMIANASDAERLPYLFMALNDCVSSLSLSRHGLPSKIADRMESEIIDAFEKNFLEKLCELIENDLRLSIHSHLKLDDRNPFIVPLNVCTTVLRLPPMRLGQKYLDIQRFIEQYLEKTFYNLTTVALHDWRTYAEMRQLAAQKYGLHLVDPHLPSQTLEQGLDVLEIMRNIHVFVAKYLYNLNNQVFVEYSSNNKHLNVLNIGHIANSIRTHGTGIMNTAVNFTYQFLRNKFYVFSQFLYDDHIKSKLIKDVRYFRENKDKLNGMFPVDKAEKFNRSIRKLGLSPDGLSFFDQFRQLITHIGNALGYVRMVRAGGLQFCGQSIQFIPDLDDVVQIAPLVEQPYFSSETRESASIFDSLIGSLIKNSSEGTQYFRLFVDVFAAEFRNPKHVHLKSFFIVVPALVLNYVENISSCKERLGKKAQETAMFTDDGFAMGVAYILKLLDQNDDFDSLHWFRSIKEKYAKEKIEIEKQLKGETKDSADVKLAQTLTLTLKRIEMFIREYELVSFSLRSARVFFRTDALTELIPKEKEVFETTSDAGSLNASNI